jgi:hypothetical protein
LLEKRLSVGIRAIKWVPHGSLGNKIRNKVPARIFSLRAILLKVIPK